MCLHLILSDCLSATDVENLNKTSKPFAHFHKILSHAEHNEVFKLFQDDPDYALQTSIPVERRLQFLFLSVTHRPRVPSITRSITGNYTASYRDPDTMLRECQEMLPLDLLPQIKRVLCHHNPTKFLGRIIAEERRQVCAYGSHVLVANNVSKV